MNYETTAIPVTTKAVDASATPAVTKLSTVIFGVFFGNILTAIVVGGIYALLTAK